MAVTAPQERYSRDSRPSSTLSFSTRSFALQISAAARSSRPVEGAIPRAGTFILNGALLMRPKFRQNLSGSVSESVGKTRYGNWFVLDVRTTRRSRARQLLWGVYSVMGWNVVGDAEQQGRGIRHDRKW
jgi:hypothetical protein